MGVDGAHMIVSFRVKSPSFEENQSARRNGKLYDIDTYLFLSF